MGDRFSRQQFLGENSEDVIGSIRVGIIGLGGGGSHVVQQLAHVGVRQFLLSDPQRIDSSNLNRLVGATASDVAKAEWKTAIARRVIHGVDPAADVVEVRDDWRSDPVRLRECDVIVGCVDTYQARAELEAQSRRYLTPYIDIGMDVHALRDDHYLISGQVIVSMPGQPCLRCLGFLRDELLAQEASRYGDAGLRPQVVWSNGVLASTAVGELVQLFSPWHAAGATYLEYDGNVHTMRTSNRVLYAGGPCAHFPARDVGDPWFVIPVPGGPLPL